jgi:hypothetical protein
MLVRGDEEMELCSMKKLYNPPILTELTEEPLKRLWQIERNALKKKRSSS